MRALERTSRRADRLRRVRQEDPSSNCKLLPGRTRTRTECPASTSCRATWLPTNPVAPVTSVVIECGKPLLLRPCRGGCYAHGRRLRACHVAMTVRLPVPVAVRLGRLAALEPAHPAGERPAQHLPGVAEFLVAAEHRGGLVARVHHAILAARIAAVAVFLPRSFFDEVFEGLVMRVGHQVARALPAARIVGGISPGGAHQLALAAQKFHVNRRSHDVVALEQRARLPEFFADFRRAT